jgi:hypothetical protein
MSSPSTGTGKTVVGFWLTPNLAKKHVAVKASTSIHAPYLAIVSYWLAMLGNYAAREISIPTAAVLTRRCAASPYVGRYVSHDLAALDQTEVLCWDGWGMTDVPPGGSLAEEELALLDAVAAATVEGRTGGFNADPQLRARGEIHSYSAAGFYTITIP